MIISHYVGLHPSGLDLDSSAGLEEAATTEKAIWQRTVGGLQDLEWPLAHSQ